MKITIMIRIIILIKVMTTGISNFSVIELFGRNCATIHLIISARNTVHMQYIHNIKCDSC